MDHDLPDNEYWTRFGGKLQAEQRERFYAAMNRLDELSKHSKEADRERVWGAASDMKVGQPKVQETLLSEALHQSPYLHT